MQASGDCSHHIYHLDIRFSGNTSRGGASGRADEGVRSTWRRGVQASGDFTHHICHLDIGFHEIHQEVVPLGEMVQESGISGEEECRL